MKDSITLTFSHICDAGLFTTQPSTGRVACVSTVGNGRAIAKLQAGDIITVDVASTCAIWLTGGVTATAVAGVITKITRF